MITRRALLATVIAAGLLSGCATINPEPGFQDVEEIVSERTGRQIQWNQATPADEAVAVELRAMVRDTLTADEAVQIALLNNQGLQATYEALAVAQADLVRAGLLSNPIFDGAARFSDAGTALDFGIAQSFIDIFFIPLRRRVAGIAYEAAKLEVAGAVIDLAAETRRTFYEVQGAAQLVELWETVLLAFEASYEMAERLHAAGNITNRELVLERAQYEEANVDLAEAKAQVLLTRERLNALMGLWMPSMLDWTIEERLPEIPEDETELERLEERAVANSLGLEILRSQIMMAGAQLGLARPEALIPEAEIGVIAEREPEGEWAFGPTLSLPLPIFNWGQAATATVRAQLRRVQNLYAARGVAVRAAARAARTRVTAARERAAYSLAVVLPLREQVVATTQLQYNAMQIGIFQLLEARRQQIRAGMDYIQALEEYWLARADVRQLLNGRLGRIAPPTIEMNGATETSGPEDEDDEDH